MKFPVPRPPPHWLPYLTLIVTLVAATVPAVRPVVRPLFWTDMLRAGGTAEPTLPIPRILPVASTAFGATWAMAASTVFEVPFLKLIGTNLVRYATASVGCRAQTGFSSMSPGWVIASPATPAFVRASTWLLLRTY